MLHVNNDPSNEAIIETPAYKQFWPWFLFLLPASAVVAGIVTLFIAQDMGKDRFLQNYQKLGRVVVSREASREASETANAHSPTQLQTQLQSKPNSNLNDNLSPNVHEQITSEPYPNTQEPQTL